jgi:hypothetical protein
MAGMVKRVAPLAYEAWLDYDIGGVHLSRAELAVLRELLEAGDGGIRARAGAAVDAAGLAGHGLSQREVRELLGKLQPREHLDFELDLRRMRPAEEIEARMRDAVPAVERLPAE